MAKLSSSARAAIPSGNFALPGRRFPIEDKDHARAALIDVGRANISSAQKATVKRKAEAKLSHSSVFNPGANHDYAAGPRGAKPAVARAIHDGEKAKLFGRMGGY